MPSPIGQSLRALAGWVVAASLGAAPGCANSSVSRSVPTACDEGLSTVNVFVDPVTLTSSPSSLEAYRSLQSRGVGPNGPSGPPVADLIGSMGTACSDATGSTCSDTRNELVKPSRGCGELGACRPFLLMTAGDTATRLESEMELLHLLGAIDTPAEAALVGVWHGLTLACPGLKGLAGTEVEPTAGGFLVRSEGGLREDAARFDCDRG
jgi:hypothetical protein